MRGIAKDYSLRHGGDYLNRRAKVHDCKDAIFLCERLFTIIMAVIPVFDLFWRISP